MGIRIDDIVLKYGNSTAVKPVMMESAPNLNVIFSL